MPDRRTKAEQRYVIVEHVAGVWSYHLARPREPCPVRSLCDKPVMWTGVPAWGVRCGNESIHYKWCKECAAIRDEETDNAR